MSNYRRVYIKGGCFFFTIVTAKRQPVLVEYIELLRDAFQHVRSRHPFTIDAAVILPDHLHCIWTLPENDHDYPCRWRMIKGYFSRQLPNKASNSIWQRRFWEHMIRDAHDYKRHLDYIHYNPVKHGYVEHVSDWEYSSFNKFIRQGLYEENWSDPVDKDMDYE